jgi:hypothetical protein
MEEGETRHPVKKRHDNGALIKALLVRPPCLQCAARHVKHLCRLTLGEALGLQIAIALTQLSAFDAVPALMTVFMATLLILDDCAHTYLLFQPLAFVFVLAKDGEGAFWFQPFAVSSH